jgi:transposase
VLAAVDRGVSRKEVAEVFGVSVPTIKRWLRRRHQTGDVESKPITGPPARKGAALEDHLPAQLRANPDLTLEEHRELFQEAHGVKAFPATVSPAFKRLGLRPKRP